MSIESTIMEMAKSARLASKKIATSSSDKKNAALLAIAEKIEKKASTIKSENQNKATA